MALVATMIMQLTYEVGLRSASARVLFYITSISAYLMFAYYTCDLTARMTSGPAQVPIRSFQGLINHISLQNCQDYSTIRVSNS